MVSTARLLFELGLLKVMQRSGWLTIGELVGDTVAAHSFRAAFIAFYLAKRAGADPYKAAFAALVHDVGEARIGDLTPIAKAYCKADEERAVKEALSALPFSPEEVGEREWVIAKDADKLEMLVTAKEYVERGNPLAKEWMESALRALKTEEAKALAKEILSTPSRWWEGMKKD